MVSYRFKEARIQAGLTTTQLAQHMGVTQAAVSHWDTGKKVPGTDTLCRLADLYGVTVDYLLGRSDPRKAADMQTETLNSTSLPILHGKPVWLQEHGWGIVNSIQGYIIFMDGSKISFDEASEVRSFPPAFTIGYYPLSKPIAHSDLKKYDQIWIEPLSPDSFTRDELRGWYKIKSFYAENEYGTRFLFDSYGSKWLAFEQKL